MKPLLPLCLLASIGFSSCCRIFHSYDNTRFLEGYARDTFCCLVGSPTLINVYHAFPSKDYREGFNTFASTTRITDSSRILGPYGIRVDHFLPFVWKGRRFISTGLDYSYSDVRLQGTQVGQAANMHQKIRITHHRMKLNNNVYFIIKSPWYAYGTIQAGLVIKNSKIFTSQLNRTNHSDSYAFDFRAGLGIRYDLNKRFGLSAEAGYPDGGYFRGGIFFWL